MATIGVLVNHYDARNDIRGLVAELSQVHNVVLLGPDGVLRGLSPPAGVEFRPTVKRLGVARAMLEHLYGICGFVPESRENFIFNEQLKCDSVVGFRRALALAKLKVRLTIPTLISPEAYFSAIAQCDITPIEDIDGFLLITEFSDVALAARAAASGKPCCAYVYSWDHPCKHTTYSKRIGRYAVWNSAIAEDISQLQGIPISHCVATGATQLSPVHEALRAPPGDLSIPFDGQPFFYFGCGIGHRTLAELEMQIARMVAISILENAPDHLLVVRPYPMSRDLDFRHILNDLPNIRWDDEFQSAQHGRSLTGAQVLQRLHIQRQATGFIHLGTTMGFEGAFLNVPCILLTLPGSDAEIRERFRPMEGFSNQYHLLRHLRGGPGTVKLGTEELAHAIRLCLMRSPDVLADNQRVRGDTQVRALPDIAAQLAELSLS